MDLRKVHFLIVEDSHETVRLVRSILVSWGAQVFHEAPDVGRAIEALGANPDILILDLNVGPDDGLSLLRYIRNEAPNPYVPTIVLSADARPGRIAEARDAGADEFLGKPFTARGLYVKLQSVIHRRRPFVRSADYFGPDRRRREDPDYAGPERRRG